MDVGTAIANFFSGLVNATDNHQKHEDLHQMIGDLKAAIDSDPTARAIFDPTDNPNDDEWNRTHPPSQQGASN